VSREKLISGVFRRETIRPLTVGSCAELILWADNPLDDLPALRNRLGVMVQRHQCPGTDRKTLVKSLPPGLQLLMPARVLDCKYG